MKTVKLYEAKTHLSALVDEAAAGEEIIIAKGDRPVAVLSAIGDRLSPREPITVLRGDFDEVAWKEADAEIASMFLGSGKGTKRR